ncbi:MAG: hypothetical protein IV104_03245 [Acidovorax sp.]|nr:hypothetical protein [Acidovorax sp.]
MKISLSITGLDAVKRQIANADKQVRFAASRALNETAQEVRKAIPGELSRSLDRPTPFTTSDKATFVRPATKERLEAAVQFKDRQASYLRYQLEGGLRQPARKALRLPSAIGLDQHGNLPKGIIKQLVAIARKEGKLGKRRARRIKVSNKLELFYGDPKDLGARKFPPGIYKIVSRGKGVGAQLIPLIVFPEQAAKYEKRVDLEPMARAVVLKTFGPAFERELRAALQSAIA